MSRLVIFLYLLAVIVVISAVPVYYYADPRIHNREKRQFGFGFPFGYGSSYGSSYGFSESQSFNSYNTGYNTGFFGK